MLAQEVQKLEQENISLKESIKSLTERLGEEPEKPKRCEQCKNYIQHYVKTGIQYHPTHCGHCVHGICKKRKPDDTCKYFE